MSMTRAEAIERLEKLIALYEMGSAENKMIDYSGIIDTLKFSLTALHPVSREQVEKVWRGEWVHKQSSYDYKIFVCKKCGKQISIQGEPLIFCPACGAAQTDEAAQMVMERWKEALE